MNCHFGRRHEEGVIDVGGCDPEPVDRVLFSVQEPHCGDEAAVRIDGEPVVRVDRLVFVLMRRVTFVCVEIWRVFVLRGTAIHTLST